MSEPTLVKVAYASVETLFGELTIDWDGTAGTVSLSGVADYETFVRIMAKLSEEGGATTAPAESADPEEQADPELPPAEEVHGAASEEWAPADGASPGAEEEPPADAAMDYSAVFARITKLTDLATLLKETFGLNSYPEILAKAQELKASGVCPMLARVDNLEKRLRTTCTVAQIPLTA